MDKRKVAFFASSIVVLVAVAGWLLLRPSNVQTQYAVEKPKFNIYGVACEETLDDYRISFNLQNLGNVSATNIIVNFTIKIAGKGMTFYYGKDLNGDGNINENERQEVPFIYIRDNLTINMMESKETNTYYIENIKDYIYDPSVVTLIVGSGDATIVIVESHWTITCGQGVRENFDF